MAEKTTIKLPKSIFNIEVKDHQLLKQAYNTYLANARSAQAKTKKRGEVRGGGKKPWRQKGTGRARFGSSRNPIWRGGGIAFGPTGDQNHKLKLPTNTKRVAIKQALSLVNQSGVITAIETFACPKGKVKETLKLLDQYKINSKDRVLLVVDNKDDLVLRATNNLANVKVVKPTYLNVFDILNADNILISKKSIPMITSWLNGEDK